MYIVEGNVNSDIFINFIQRCLLPILRPFDGGDNPCSVVVLDNAMSKQQQGSSQPLVLWYDFASIFTRPEPHRRSF